jgi:prevent-host-death family protein
MSITTLSSREFNQDASRAKRAARNGPVFITDRGRPAHVLLTIEDYQRLAGGGATIVDLLVMDEEAELEIPPRSDPARPADL